MDYKLKPVLDALEDIPKTQLPITENPQAAYLCLKVALDAVNQIKADLKTIMETHVLVEKWQDINTAPKEGNQFLVTDGECVVIAEWGNYPEPLDCHDCTSHGAIGKHGKNVTHWMPLPPALSKGGE